MADIMTFHNTTALASRRNKCGETLIDVGSIDWNEAWKKARAQRTSSARGIPFWNKRAPLFKENAAKEGYAESFLKIMNPKRAWRVLDMGCGAGTIAVPLAQQVQSVTAVDFSGVMLDILRERCRKMHISNIRIINASWEDDWSAARIGTHDVAVASRSLVVDDLRLAIMKLNGIAQKRVYVSTIVGDGPYDRRIFDAVGRKLNAGPDYIYNYNLLHQMGICAHVDFIEDRNHKTFRDHADAIDSVRWMLDKITPDEERGLKKFVNDHLVSDSGRWVFDYERTIRWAVLWWDTDH